MQYFLPEILKSSGLNSFDRFKAWQKGVTLAENLVMVTSVGFLVILLSSIPNAIALVGKGKNLSLAREIVNTQIEEHKVIPFVNLINGEALLNDSRINLLPEGRGKMTTQDCSTQICPNGEKTKQLIVTVSWNESGKFVSTTLTTLVSDK